MFNTTAFTNLNNLDPLAKFRQKHQNDQTTLGMAAPDWGSSGPQNNTDSAWSFNLQS